MISYKEKEEKVYKEAREVDCNINRGGQSSVTETLRGGVQTKWIMGRSILNRVHRISVLIREWRSHALGR